MITLDGHRVETATVHVPGVGPWFADLDVEGRPDVSGRATLRIGELELVGTIDARAAGTHVLERRLRLVAGGGGWATLVDARHYHNDARIRARTVAEDAARLAGEEIGDFAPASERIGIDYVREAGPAARVLEDVIGPVPWWVDYDGTTHVGPQPSSSPAADAYEVLDYQAREGVVRLTARDLRAVRIGATLTARLDEPQTVRGLRIEARPDAIDVLAWTGAETDSRDRIERSLRAFVDRVTGRRIFGKHRYRVVQMSGERVELQAVRRSGSLPDTLPLSLWPGVPGAHAELAPGAEVLIEFIEGDRTMPIVVGFAGKDGTGWSPVELVFDAGTLIKLGQNAENFVALANLVNDRIAAIRSAFNSHSHLAGSLLDSMSAAVTGSTATPAFPLEAQASVAASKVQAE